MKIEQHIEEILTSALEDRGFGIVRIQLQGSKRKTLQIMIEHLDGTPITIDDCEKVSKASSILLDVDDSLHESYILEVSSPGIDRPLTREKDFERFAGSMIKIELKTPQNGNRRFKGQLLGIEGDRVKISLDPEKEVAEFAFSDIQKAKLIPDYEISSSH